MQQALPYTRWLPLSTSTRMKPPSTVDNIEEPSRRVRNLISENPVLVFGRSGCCMCHVVKHLLQGLGVNPSVYEVEEEEEVAAIQEFLGNSGDLRPQFPSVFIGGRLVGGLDQLMAVHISGDLVPILKQAGALWL
eukprot:TRINITY_DN4534_c0_g4_i2.p1 TRINITY_DN4534_c0_g4~~TRINITY_DN4534_c0_g4_i2.p1  ORF type:complete len:135 (+),score=11.35 TRINITY_DN4534_c0_g4_i2:341-745(+)